MILFSQEVTFDFKGGIFIWCLVVIPTYGEISDTEEQDHEIMFRIGSRGRTLLILTTHLQEHSKVCIRCIYVTKSGK